MGKYERAIQKQETCEMGIKLHNKILIKPLTSNRCWQGRRFKTPLYADYEREMAILLKKGLNVPQDVKLRATYRFGLSSKLADIDNPVKPLQDILQKQYGFNDKMIYEMHVYKEIVPKGEEYVEFDIVPIFSTEEEN